MKSPTAPGRSRIAVAATPARIRTQPPRSTTPTNTKPAGHATAPPAQDSAPPPLSIKEVIALRRAEAKKAQTSIKGVIQNDFMALEDASSVPTTTKQEEEDILGRLPMREIIERARSTGEIEAVHIAFD